MLSSKTEVTLQILVNGKAAGEMVVDTMDPATFPAQLGHFIPKGKKLDKIITVTHGKLINLVCK